MKVLSLFDGMSCGMIALDRLGIKVDKYYASEIDKYAIQVSQANYPNIIQIGDVCDIKAEDYQDIDLILAGSPCQGFSFAGKQLAFDDPRSALFFEFIRLLKEIKPKYFLLENVNMKKEFLDVISEQVSSCYPELPFGIERIKINSALVSAQNRLRWYWTNIPGVDQPEQRGIVLRDILEYQLEDNTNAIPNKSQTIKSQYYKSSKANFERSGTFHATGIPQKLVDDTSDLPEKSSVIKANYYKSSKANFENDTTKGGKFSATGIPQKLEKVQKPLKVGMNVETVKVRKHEVDIKSLQYVLREMKAESKKTNRQIAEETNLPITKVEHWFRTDSSFAIPSDDVWLKLKEVLGIQTEVFDKPIMEFEYRDGVYESTQRVYGDHGKSPTLTASNSDQLIQTSDKAQHIGTAVDIKGHDQIKRVYSPDGKSPTVTTCGGGHREPKVVMGAYRGRYNEDGSTSQKLELRKDEKTNTITTVQKDNVLTKDEVYWRKLTPYITQIKNLEQYVQVLMVMPMVM